jgi:hypothetical protein
MDMGANVIAGDRLHPEQDLGFGMPNTEVRAALYASSFPCFICATSL